MTPDNIRTRLLLTSATQTDIREISNALVEAQQEAAAQLERAEKAEHKRDVLHAALGRTTTSPMEVKVTIDRGIYWRCRWCGAEEGVEGDKAKHATDCPVTLAGDGSANDETGCRPHSV